MSDSILNSTKKVLNVAVDDTDFDLDILMHINSVFSTLNQLGLGPADGFYVENASVTWDTFLGNDSRFNMVKSYLYLRVRMLFDPPSTSFLIGAYEKQIEQYEWRLNVLRETLTGHFPTDVVVDGGTPFTVGI